MREREHGGKLWRLVEMNRNIGNKEKELAVVFIADRSVDRAGAHVKHLRPVRVLNGPGVARANDPL